MFSLKQVNSIYLAAYLLTYVCILTSLLPHKGYIHVLEGKQQDIVCLFEVEHDTFEPSFQPPTLDSKHTRWTPRVKQTYKSSIHRFVCSFPFRKPEAIMSHGPSSSCLHEGCLPVCLYNLIHLSQSTDAVLHPHTRSRVAVNYEWTSIKQE